MKLNLTTFPTYKHVNKTDFYKKTAIVIDVLRASSTITAALDNGCKDIVPVKKIGDAFAAKNAIKDGKPVFLGGEREGVKLSGYDFGNSPLEYSESLIRGSHVVLCTTNGTQAIAKAEYCDTMFIGCINNASAVAKAAAEEQKDVIILCSGTSSIFSSDDILAAGAIISKLQQFASVELDDLGTLALMLYNENRSDPINFIKHTKPYKILTALGYIADIEYCFKEDISQTVPVYVNGRIESFGK